METEPKLSVEEAVRRVFVDGGALEYFDVVREVKGRFGLHVSEGQVEQLYLDWKRSRPETASRSHVKIDLEPVALVPSPVRQAKPRQSVDALAEALRFVKAVGSVSAARAALDELKGTLDSLNP